MIGDVTGDTAAGLTAGESTLFDSDPDDSTNVTLNETILIGAILLSEMKSGSLVEWCDWLRLDDHGWLVFTNLFGAQSNTQIICIVCM